MNFLRTIEHRAAMFCIFPYRGMFCPNRSFLSCHCKGCEDNEEGRESPFDSQITV